MTPTDETALDALIQSAAELQDLPLDAAWLPAIRANLEVTLRLANDVAGFRLGDEAEPASVFEA